MGKLFFFLLSGQMSSLSSFVPVLCVRCQCHRRRRRRRHYSWKLSIGRSSSFSIARYTYVYCYPFALVFCLSTLDPFQIRCVCFVAIFHFHSYCDVCMCVCMCMPSVQRNCSWFFCIVLLSSFATFAIIGVALSIRYQFVHDWYNNIIVQKRKRARDSLVSRESILSISMCVNVVVSCVYCVYVVIASAASASAQVSHWIVWHHNENCQPSSRAHGLP